jgi:lycopene cyclase domain-containing protein
MWFYYSAYLVLVFFSSVLISKVACLEISTKRFLRALFPVFVIFVLWDVVAVERGHWKFGLQYMTGIVIWNQPLEELFFFVVIPYFYVVIWEVVKRNLFGVKS